MNSLSDAAEEDSVEICLNIQMPRTAAKVAREIDALHGKTIFLRNPVMWNRGNRNGLWRYMANMHHKIAFTVWSPFHVQNLSLSSASMATTPEWSRSLVLMTNSQANKCQSGKIRGCQISEAPTNCWGVPHVEEPRIVKQWRASVTSKLREGIPLPKAHPMADSNDSAEEGPKAPFKATGADHPGKPVNADSAGELVWDSLYHCSVPPNPPVTNALSYRKESQALKAKSFRSKQPHRNSRRRKKNKNKNKILNANETTTSTHVPTPTQLDDNRTECQKGIEKHTQNVNDQLAAHIAQMSSLAQTAACQHTNTLILNCHDHLDS